MSVSAVDAFSVPVASERDVAEGVTSIDELATHVDLEA
jgi:hypothetical protein